MDHPGLFIVLGIFVFYVLLILMVIAGDLFRAKYRYNTYRSQDFFPVSSEQRSENNIIEYQSDSEEDSFD